MKEENLARKKEKNNSVPDDYPRVVWEKRYILPQTEHSGDPLGDPSARVFEVFLIVSQSVRISRRRHQGSVRVKLFRMTWPRAGKPRPWLA